MKEDSFNKWLKSGLKKEREARKPRPFNVIRCSLDAPKEGKFN